MNTPAPGQDIENAAVAEARNSPLPGLADGPANAYLHLLIIGELRRRFGVGAARFLGWANEVRGSHPMQIDATGQSEAERVMDTHNNRIGLRLGARARTFEDVVRLARLSIMDGLERSGSGEANTPTWLGLGNDPDNRRERQLTLPPPADWPLSPVDAGGYAKAGERFQFMGDTIAQLEADWLDRLGTRHPATWSEDELRRVVRTLAYRQRNHPEHAVWQDRVRT